jgi:hypothetical protein
MKLAHEVSFHTMPSDRRCAYVILQMDLPDNNLRKFACYNGCNIRILHVFIHVTLFLKRAYMRSITL